MTMTDPRPVCVYAMANLKRNSTKLLITMCIGIALAFYGIYVQARSRSNPSYLPSITVVTHWMYSCLGSKLIHPSKMMKSCQQTKVMGAAMPHFLMRFLILPMVHYSGIINGFININQIILLKVYCKSLRGTSVIIGMSVMGAIISALCMIGAFATCKLMCISCLGIHHGFIIYYGMCRYRIIKNMLCPPGNTNEGACVFGTATATTTRSTSSNQTGSDIRKRRT